MPTDAQGTVALTYLDVSELSHRVAGALRAAGINAGSRVAVYSPNDVTALVIVIGILRAAATWVALNPRSKTTISLLSPSPSSSPSSPMIATELTSDWRPQLLSRTRLLRLESASMCSAGVMQVSSS